MRTTAFAILLLMGFIPGALAAETANAVSEDDTEFSQMSILNPSKEFQVFLDLAKTGDSRAQFILGDIYAKGRSGLKQSDDKARKWFERAARQNYNPAFVRLAALEKRVGDPVAAYKWYELALDRFDSNTKTYAFAKEAQSSLDLSSKQQSEAKHLASLWAAGKKENRKPESEEKPEAEIATKDKKEKAEKPAKVKTEKAEKKAAEKPKKESEEKAEETTASAPKPKRSLNQ